MSIMQYKVLVYRDEDGVFIAECVDLPGCVSDGKTKKEAVSNVKEAIQAYLESVAKERTQTIKGAELISVTL